MPTESFGPRTTEIDWPGCQSRTVPVMARGFVTSLTEKSHAATAIPSEMMSNRSMALGLISVLQQPDDVLDRPDAHLRCPLPSLASRGASDAPVRSCST